MQTSQMQNRLGNQFSGSKLNGRRGLAGSALRFNASFRPAGARRSGLIVKAEKVGGFRCVLPSHRGCTLFWNILTLTRPSLAYRLWVLI